ncbi:MAG TPA: hypothetical protein VH330_03420 [Candidatus Udaeobacter sp.]|jgi:hypothetical protein
MSLLSMSSEVETSLGFLAAEIIPHSPTTPKHREGGSSVIRRYV